MFETLLHWDHTLFTWINHDWTNGFFDWFFPRWTDYHKTTYFKFGVFPAILALTYWRLRWKGLVFVLMLAVAVAINDGINGKWIKFFFERPRPPLVPELQVMLRAPHYGGFSFPSNHAANMAFIAAFVTLYFPSLRWILFTMAFLTAYSRVYCGVHFPSDVIGGFIFGCSFGLVLAWLMRPLWRRIENV